MLTCNFEDAGWAVAIGLAGDLSSVLQVRVLEDQLPLLPLHHDLHAPLLHGDLLAVSVPGIRSQISSDWLLVVLTMTRRHRPPPRRSRTRSGRAPPHSGPSAGTWRCGDTLAKYNFLIICPPPTFVIQIFTFDLQPTVSLVLLAVFDKFRNLHTVCPGVVQLAHSEHQTQLFSLVYSLNSSVRGVLKCCQY